MKKTCLMILTLVMILSIMAAPVALAEMHNGDKCSYWDCEGGEMTVIKIDDRQHATYCSNIWCRDSHYIYRDFSQYPMSDGRVLKDYPGMYIFSDSQEEAYRQVEEAIQRIMTEHADEIDDGESGFMLRTELSALGKAQELISTNWDDPEYLVYQSREDHYGGGATCTKSGKCEGCGATYTKPHNWIWVQDTAPTCGKAGTKHEECTVCRTKRNQNTPDPATGDHSWTWVIDENPTCSTAGKQHEKCSNCDATRSENTPIPATGQHTWDWVIDEDATCSKDGKKHEKCKYCDATRNPDTVIKKTDHVWGDTPSCSWTEDGGVKAVLTCIFDPSHTTDAEAQISGDPDVILPTETEDGKYVYPVTVTSEDKEYKGTVEKTIARAEKGTYSAEGGPFKWTKGSSTDIELRFARKENDDITFRAFRTLMVDGATVEGYTAEEGSVIITLGADYLGSLPEGEHTVRAEFSDGSAETVLLIQARKTNIPETGVNGKAGVYMILVLTGMIAAACAVPSGKKEET